MLKMCRTSMIIFFKYIKKNKLIHKFHYYLLFIIFQKHIKQSCRKYIQIYYKFPEQDIFLLIEFMENIIKNNETVTLDDNSLPVIDVEVKKIIKNICFNHKPGMKYEGNTMCKHKKSKKVID